MYTIETLSAEQLRIHCSHSRILTGLLRVTDTLCIIIEYTDRGIHQARFTDQSEIETPEAPQISRLVLAGTPFECMVWRAAMSIAPGSTMTYAQLAASIDSPRAARAVGKALGKNPLAYLIPCHRIIHSDGSLGAFAWGATRKMALLDAERRLIQGY